MKNKEKKLVNRENRNMTEIDIVLLWVDGSDKKWRAERKQYLPKDKQKNLDNSENRFRDWGLLKYLFRSIEQNMSWVRKIHFVTWGHIPEWLDVNNEKINIVRHEDFIPKEFLPTFNTNVIHYYLNRVPGLAEKFIVFDDDIYVLKPVKPTDFFVGDKIREDFAETVIDLPSRNDVFPYEMLNNIQCINEHYDKKCFYKKNLFKCLNPKYGLKRIYGTLVLQRWSFFTGFYSSHICQPYTKYLFDKFWKHEKEKIEQISKNRFRSTNDYTIHLLRFIAFMEGKFVARNHKFGRRFELGVDDEKICDALTKRKYKVVCLNDSSEMINFDKISFEMKEIFEKLFPERSIYEK